jgi:hypothetical protein
MMSTKGLLLLVAWLDNRVAASANDPGFVVED